MPSKEAHELLLRRALKPRDFWWTVLVIDPIAVRLLPPLVRARWVTPTGISLVALALGAFAVASFALGELLLGAILYQVRFLLDCLDGKLARVRDETSAWGRFVDLAGDTTVIGGAYAALGYHALRTDVAGAWAVLVLLTAFSVAVWLHQYQRSVAAPASSSPAVSHPATGARVWSMYRFNRHPGSVEVEALALFVFPIALPFEWFATIVVIAALFYLASAAEVVWDLRRRLAVPGAEGQAD